MKIKILICTLCVFLGLQMLAEDFKIGDVKYKVLDDGTVELSESKKASGEVVIPQTVINPKTQKEYKVSAIGQSAFKNTPVTSVTLPETVLTIKNGAFSGCKSLASVNLDYVNKIEPRAFLGTALTNLVISPWCSYIGTFAFMDCKNLQTIMIQAHGTPEEMDEYINQRFEKVLEGANINRDDPARQKQLKEDYESYYHRMLEAMGLRLEPSAFYDVPAVAIYIGRSLLPNTDDPGTKSTVNLGIPTLKEIFIGPLVTTDYMGSAFDDCPDATIIFENEKAGEQAATLFAKMWNSKLPQLAQHYFFGETFGQSPRALYTTREYLTDRGCKLPEDKRICFGVKRTDNLIEAAQSTPFDAYQAVEYAYDQMARDKFIERLDEFVRVAVEEPQNLPNEYRKITPWESVKYDDLLTHAITELCDSVYLVKPTLTDAELENVSGFVSNFFMHIGADYGIANMRLSEWAEKDILTRDLNNDAHKDDYQHVLNSIDRYFTFKKPSKDPYHQTMQLAALCGLGRWKEAASYFPKVHRAVTDNGVYAVPSELTYIQTAINNHGYKAVAPTYTKASAKKSGSGSWTELFGQAIAEAAVQTYQDYRERRAYKKWLKNIDRKFEKNLKKGKIR